MNKEKCNASRERGTAPANLWGPPCLCLSLACTALLRVGSTVRPPPAHRQLSPMQISSSVSASPMQRNLNSLRESANLRLADDRSVRGNADVSTGTARHSVPPAPQEGYTQGPPVQGRHQR